MNHLEPIHFDELFDIDELQQLQDQIAFAFGVASIITHPDGTPITRSSNFTRLCQNIIRCSKKGQLNCKHSDAMIGRHNPSGPVIQPCLSGGLWDAGASITVGNQHVANWLIGQVRNEFQDEDRMREYAREIDADEADFMQAYSEIPSMPKEKFQQIAEVLFTLARQLSEKAYHNLLQKTVIAEKQLAEKALLEKEERFHHLFERAPLGYQSLNEDGCLIEINQAWCETLGYSREEVIGKWFGDFLAPEYVDQFRERFLMFKKLGKVHSEFAMVHENGECRFIAFDGRIGYKNDGSFEKTHCILQDITEIRKVEAELRKSEEKMRGIVQMSPTGIGIICDRVILEVNPRICEMTGYSAEELIGRNSRILYPTQEEYDLVGNTYKQIIDKGAGIAEIYLKRKDGALINVIILLKAIEKTDLSRGVIYTVFDITERKQAEQKLREQEHRLSSLVGNLPGFVYRCKYDEGWTMLFVSEGCQAVTGYLPEDLIGNKTISFNEIIKEEYRECLFAQWEQIIADKTTFYQEYEIITASGEIRWVLEQAVVVYDEDNNVKFLEGYIDDISERKKAESALKESEETIRLLFNSTAEGIYGIDTKGECTFCNRAALTMLGYTDESDLLGKNMHQLIHHSYNDGTFLPVEECQVYKAFKDGLGSYCDQEVFWTKSGDSFPVEYWSYPILRDNNVIGSVVTFIDITQKRQMGEQLAKSESKYRHLFENNPAPMWIYDMETLAFLEVNEAAIDHYGYSHAEFLKLSLKDIRPTEDIGKLILDVDTTTNLLNRAGTWRHKKKNGEIIYVDIVSHRIEYESRDARLVISTDITERVNTQLEIEEERLLLRTLINNLPVAVYIKNREGKKIISNQADWERFGFQDESQILGKTVLELYKGEPGRRFFRDDMQVIQTGEAIINREEVFPVCTGAKRIFLTSSIPLYDRNQEIIGILGVDREITESKKANDQILKLSRSVEQSPTVVVITDKNGQIEYVNSKFSEITGYTKDEAIGQTPRILKSGMMPTEFYQTLWETITLGEIWSGEIHNRKKNGELYWDRTIISPLRSEKGEITNYISTKEDISDRKQMEEDLIVSKRRAEASDRLKSAFLANMSHEIRTPLNSIIGFSELLNDPDFPEDQKSEFIHHIISNGNNLLNIISDIVDISKIEAGEIAIRKGVVKVCGLIENIKKQHFIKIVEKPVEFRWVCPEDKEDLYVLADKERMEQVLTNLLNNAIKFTSSGHIDVGYQPVNGYVEFYISDTGIGIPPEFHDKIFDRFRQVEGEKTRKYGGNGLGLTITKNLIELMGGKIRVESEPGKGSTFYFTLPRITEETK